MHNTFALVLLDVNMPDMSGYEVAELITKSNMHRNTPIVMVTAQGAETAEVLKAYEAGAVDYLAKPIIPLVVLNKVRQFVALHKSQQNASILKAEREAILDAAGEGVIKISQHGIIDYCNTKACQLLCDEKKEIIGSSINRWFHVANENDFETEVRREQSSPDLYDGSYDNNKLFSIILDGVRKLGMYQKKDISILSNTGGVMPVEITCTLTMTEEPSIILLFSEYNPSY